MGRELRRKQAKKEGKSLTQAKTNEENQLKVLLKIVGLLVFIIAVIYIISGVFITKEIKWFNNLSNGSNNNSNSNVSSSILASSIFKQSEEEYYVYFYDFNDENSTISNQIKTKLSNSKIYRVDTSSALNSNYVGEESNKDAKNLEQLKVKAPTLIKIVDDSITEYYEGDEITNNLK